MAGPAVQETDLSVYSQQLRSVPVMAIRIIFILSRGFGQFIAVTVGSAGAVMAVMRAPSGLPDRTG
jgi:hypothetical protein